MGLFTAKANPDVIARTEADLARIRDGFAERDRRHAEIVEAQKASEPPAEWM